MAAEYDEIFTVLDDFGDAMVIQDASPLTAWLNQEIDLEALEMLEDDFRSVS